jgi:flagellar biosynthesis/type III secretory pathway protein FliH
MERNSNLITCPISEELQETLGITDDSILDAHYADGTIINSVVDADEYEAVELDSSEEDRDFEGSYALGRLAGQLEGYKEGYREGYKDGFEDRTEKDCECQCKRIDERTEE